MKEEWIDKKLYYRKSKYITSNTSNKHTHTLSHTHTGIYIYIYICLFVEYMNVNRRYETFLRKA